MNTPKNKGTAAETAVVRWLRNNGFPNARRIALAGANDQGDVWMAPGLILEVKNVALAATGQPPSKMLEKWLGELTREMRNGEGQFAHWGALVVKRKGTMDPGSWWCYTFAADVLEFLAETDVPKAGEWVCMKLSTFARFFSVAARNYDAFAGRL